MFFSNVLGGSTGTVSDGGSSFWRGLIGSGRNSSGVTVTRSGSTNTG